MRLTAAGYRVVTQSDGRRALAGLKDVPPALMITDLRMDAMDGMTLFGLVRERYPTLPVIILTAHGSIPEAVDATQRGAFGFLTKPFDGKHLLAEVDRALRLAGSPAGSTSRPVDDDGIITQNPRMRELLDKLPLVAAARASVLLLGESGTGKDLIARAIHRHSPRAGKPFVPLNCAAVPESLLESELFGHVRGAFTGAVKDHLGLIRAADGGTLFLDEIGDMPLELQPRLLRTLEERRVTPVGSTQAVEVDIRLISATHRQLPELARDGRFRSDLMYRINTVVLEVMPLRERPEDIVLLAQHFLETMAAELGRGAHSFAPEALERLVASQWPGNVRQLRNVVEQAVTLATSPVIPEDLITAALHEDSRQLPPLAEARQQFEREYLERVLRIAGGNVARAAQLANRNRTEFYRLLRRHDLRPVDFQS